MTPLRKSTEISCESESAPCALITAAGLVEDRAERELEKIGLSPGKLAILKQLSSSNRPVPMSELANLAMCVRSNITQVVDRLERDKLVKRTPDPKDRRSILVTLTTSGKKLQTKGTQIMQKLETEFETLVPSKDRDAIIRVLSALRTFSIVAIGVILVACQKAPPPPPPPEVTTAEVIARQVTDWNEYTGRFESPNSVEIQPRVSGYVQSITFTEGEYVHQGDLLFTIDPRPYAAEVARAQAELDRARTRDRLATSELERAKKLLSTQAISRQEFEARTSGMAEGDANVRGAEAALQTARLNLEWTKVRAPISGKVGRAMVTPGNVIQAGSPTPLTTIVSLDPMYVYFDGDEQAYLKYVAATTNPKVTRRRPVQVGLANDTGFPYSGFIDFVDNRVDPAAGTIRLRAVLRNTNQQLTPGLFARVKLIGATSYPAILIRDQAVGTDQDKKFVLVLKKDSVEYREVKLGPIFEGLRVVTSGLNPGEQVVINGLQHVRPGMKVIAKNTAMVPDNTNVTGMGAVIGAKH